MEKAAAGWGAEAPEKWAVGQPPDVDFSVHNELEHPEDSFSVIDWEGYPGANPPSGPFRLRVDEDYAAARKAADRVNKATHRANPTLKGLHIHETHPVKFGGDPIDAANKIVLIPDEHFKFSIWWKKLQRDLEK